MGVCTCAVLNLRKHFPIQKPAVSTVGKKWYTEKVILYSTNQFPRISCARASLCSLVYSVLAVENVL